jgi:hypothetical protein
MRNLTAKFFLLVFVVLLLVPLKAQNVASITGVVTDPTKAVIPNVNIILENTLTGVTYVSTTNAVGSYTFNEIKPGPGYKIAFSHDGFKPLTISDIYLNVDTTRTQNARLSIGSAAQTVEVSATNENETLDTTDATIGNSVEVQELNNLPIQNRDSPSALFYQQPGVTLDGAVTGARVDQSNVTLDGLDVNQLANGAFGAIIGTAPVDSVQEFRGVTAGQLSSAGEGGGGQFELVTRSGTNNFHGALVEYHRDTDLEANDWFNNNSGTKRPPLVRNQFGGNVGGPILKNRAFFFFDYNGRKDARSYVVDRTVPMGTNTSGFRGGFLSYVDGNGAANTLTTAQLNGYDPQGVGFNSPLLSLIAIR